ncbi:DUF4198 domain-containing protein [Chelatococcus sp. SYSU_G07232]|uniref:DUF4198 domain-containing protein n=1 Tax=Chelatococcus albus TaxID=3047466 RepID=A0ABT7AHV4_9HYPH|nr:DUF4198 domain-containing protein [Chelatococcus sp. SYSU_G07232]MDJ1158938.1 DUF4198 domain-containing protein [Chelatococcus sp. SYSU_G07232]
MKAVRIKTVHAALAAALALVPGAARAHGIFVAQRHGDLAVVYGHGAADDAYAPEKVKEATARSAGGEPVPVSLKPQEKYVLVEPAREAAVLSVTFDGGFWSKTRAGKWINKGRSEVADAETAQHSLKFNTTVLAATGGPLAPQGLPLEIVPLADPLTLRMGDDLPVRVLMDGKPLAGANVLADYVNEGHGTSFRTDKDGKAVIVLRNDGLNVLAVSASVPTTGNREVDKLGLHATLSFTLPHGGD